jgi:hypothetical protein
VLDAVDLLLDRGNDRGRDDVGVRARILAADIDDRRGDLRILRDRQPEERDRSEEHKHDRDPTRDVLGVAPCFCGLTLAPGRTRAMP